MCRFHSGSIFEKELKDETLTVSLFETVRVALSVSDEIHPRENLPHRITPFFIHYPLLKWLI